MRPLAASWLGRIGYAEALAMQHAVAGRVASGTSPDTLLLLEHEPVYTLGRRAPENEVLLDRDALAQRGIDVQRTDRGGRVTYHGPGQLVGYPILDLGPLADVHEYVCELQRAMIAVCAAYGVEAVTDPEHVGVWVGGAKIGAIGVHIARGITTHGFALNVAPDLGAFNGIVPCGIVDRGVTSLALLGVSPVPGVDEVARAMAERLAGGLGRSLAFVETSTIAAAEHV